MRRRMKRLQQIHMLANTFLNDSNEKCALKTTEGHVDEGMDDVREKCDDQSGDFLVFPPTKIKEEPEDDIYLQNSRPEEEIYRQRTGPEDDDITGKFLTIYQPEMRLEPEDSDDNFEDFPLDPKLSDEMSQESGEYCSRVQQLGFILEESHVSKKTLLRKPAERRYLPPTKPGGRRRLVRSAKRYSRKKIFRTKRLMKALEQARIVEAGLLGNVSPVEDRTVEICESVSTVQPQENEKQIRLMGDEDFDKIFEKESLLEDLDDLNELPVEFKLLNMILRTVDDPPEVEILDF